MNGISCPRCGGVNPPSAAFCGACGAPLPAQQPITPAESPLKPIASGSEPIQPSLPPPYTPVPNVDPPPAGSYQTPAGAYQPPPGAYPPPKSVYPPVIPGAKIVGDNTKWAVGLGIAALFCCGPVTGIIGFFLAKRDMDEIAAGRAPFLDESWAKGAYYLNIIALVLFVFGICVFSGLGRMRHF